MLSRDRSVDLIYNSTGTGGTVLWMTQLLAQLRLIIALYVVLGDHDEQADGSKYPLYGTWLGMTYTTMCGYRTAKCMTTAVSFISKSLLASLQLPAPHTDNVRTSVKKPRITCVKWQSNAIAAELLTRDNSFEDLTPKCSSDPLNFSSMYVYLPIRAYEEQIWTVRGGQEESVNCD